MKNIYISATEPRSGKSAVALGLYKLLSETTDKIGFLKPIGRNDGDTIDADITLVKELFDIDASHELISPVGMNEAKSYIASGNTDGLLTKILRASHTISDGCDITIVEGTDFTGTISALEFDINADISKTLDAPVIMVANGQGRSVEEIISQVNAARQSFDARGCDFIGAIVTKIDPENLESINTALETAFSRTKLDLLGIFPYDPLLGRPRMREIATKIGAKVLFGSEYLNNLVSETKVAAMTIGNVLGRLSDGMLLITPGDRDDMILAAMVSRVSGTYPNISGVVLTGGLEPADSIKKLIGGLTGFSIPILQLPMDTFESAIKISQMEVSLYADDSQKIEALYRATRKYVKRAKLDNYLNLVRTPKQTPIAFLNDLIERSQGQRMRVVLPEGEEDRTLKAVARVLEEKMADVILLGDPKTIKEKAIRLDAKIDGAVILDPANSERLEAYTDAYYEMRKHKGITRDHAHDVMIDPIYFGTMMVELGDADGLVSGAVHTTRHTITPAFQIIKTMPGISLVSSIFFMCLEDRVLVYGDCAINPNPSADELADIAISSSETATAFGFEPLIAMLSYSTGTSGIGPEVERVAQATEFVRQKAPGLKVEGPIQYDAAISLETAKTKLPDSSVAGRANIFIFPDLNSGNTAYKAVQRSAHAIAVGPVLQGLNKPVNDLSRGCLVEDIVYTIAITAIQAQDVLKKAKP